MAARIAWLPRDASALPRAILWSGVFCNIAGALRNLIAEYRPDSAAVEEVFFAVNAKSALKLSHVRGVALLLIAEASVELAEYSPLEVKMSVVGYGRAEKSQVQQMVASLLRLARAAGIGGRERRAGDRHLPRHARAVSGAGGSRLRHRVCLPLSIVGRGLSLRLQRRICPG